MKQFIFGILLGIIMMISFSLWWSINNIDNETINTEVIQEEIIECNHINLEKHWDSLEQCHYICLDCGAWCDETGNEWPEGTVFDSGYSEEDLSYNDKVNYNLYDNSYNTNYSDELKANSTINWKCVGLMADGKAYMYNIVILNNNTVPTYNFIVVGGEGQTTIKGLTTELFPIGQLWLEPGETNHVMICADSPDYIPDILVAYDD